MQQFESELTYVDGILRDKTYPYPELNFTLDGSGVAQNGQFDYIAHNQIVIKRAWSIVHEYCHYLLLQDGLFMEGGSLFLVKGEFNGFKSFKRIESIKESR